MILVTGASGNVGSMVLATVRESGRPVTAMYRSESETRPAPFGVRTVIADFADKDSLRQAFDNIESLFLVCSPVPQLVEFESSAIEVAKEALLPIQAPAPIRTVRCSPRWASKVSSTSEPGLSSATDRVSFSCRTTVLGST